MDTPPSSSENQDVDLAGLIRKLWARKFLLATCMVVALGIALVSLKLVPTLFEATVILEESTSSQDILGIEEPQRNPRDDSGLYTIEQKLQQASLFLEIVQTNDPELSTAPALQRALELKQQTRVQVLRRTRLIAVSVRDTNPETAQRLANEIAYTFMDREINTRRSLLDNQIDFLQSQVQEIQARIKNSAPSSERQIGEAQLRTLAERIGELQLLARYPSSSVSIVEKAWIPQRPVAPDYPATLFGALAMGIFVGLILIWLIDLLRKKPE